MLYDHEVAIEVEGKRFPAWGSYRISIDMLQPADSFSLSTQFTREAWARLRTDAEVGVYIDKTRLITGYIDQRRKRSGRQGRTIEVTGRDKTGRLVDESAPSFSFGGLHLVGLVKKIIGADRPGAPFSHVTLVNTDNRRLLRGGSTPQSRTYKEPVSGSSPIWDKFKGNPRARQHIQRVSGEQAKVTIVYGKPVVTQPGILDGRSRVPRRVRPGQKRWDALTTIFREARLLAWSTGAGDALFIGVPAYEQEPQYQFIDAFDERQSNCAINVTEDVGEMYSMYTVVGAAVGTRTTKARDRRIRKTIYANPDNTIDGTGDAFLRRKELVITDNSIRSPERAAERGERELLRRELSYRELEVMAPGHAQMYNSSRATIFAIDTLAHVIDEATGIDDDYIVVATNLEHSREGTRTTLRLKPWGSILTL